MPRTVKELERLSKLRQSNQVIFTNVDIVDFQGRYESKDYHIGTGQTKTYPQHIANHLARHLIEKILNDSDKERMRKRSKLRDKSTMQLWDMIISHD